MACVALSLVFSRRINREDFCVSFMYCLKNVWYIWEEFLPKQEFAYIKRFAWKFSCIWICKIFRSLIRWGKFIYLFISSFTAGKLKNKGAFQTGSEHIIGFLPGCFFFFMKNHPHAYYFRFDQSSWIGMVWSVSSDKWKAPLHLTQLKSDSMGFWESLR